MGMIIYMRRVLSVGLIVLLLASVLFVTAGAESLQPPNDAFDAISLALEADAELGGLVIREHNALQRLSRLRYDPMQTPNAEMAELISDIHMIWARFTARSREVVLEVLSTIIAIDTELNKQLELEELLAELTEWVNTAEKEFRTSRLDSATLRELTDRRDRVRRALDASSLQLNTSMGRFRELTGYTLPGDFDFESAWLLADIDNIELHGLTPPNPMMLFANLNGIVPPVTASVSTQALVNNARLALMELHEAVSVYARVDITRSDLERLFRLGEISKYEIYNADYERFIARITVYEQKYAYARAMLELDSGTGGIISSVYRAQPVVWFYEKDLTHEGRMNVTYAWMEHPGGSWRLSSTDNDGYLAFIIYEPWTAESVTSVMLYYENRLLAMGDINEAFIFSPPNFGRGSLAEIVFYNGPQEVGRAYIDGFANAGRFFRLAIEDECLQDLEEWEEWEEYYGEQQCDS